MRLRIGAFLLTLVLIGIAFLWRHLIHSTRRDQNPDALLAVFALGALTVFVVLLLIFTVYGTC